MKAYMPLQMNTISPKGMETLQVNCINDAQRNEILVKANSSQ